MTAKSVEIAKAHWLFLLPLVVVAGHYGFQSIVGFFKYPNGLVLTFLLALLAGAFSYIAAYRFFPTGWADKTSLVVSKRIDLNAFSISIAALYALLVIVSCVTAEHIPLFEAFKGATASDLAADRTAFLAGRTGYGQALNYVYSIMSKALMPLAMAYGFYARRKWRYAALVLIVIGSSLSLSKGSFLCVSAPLVALFLMQRRWAGAALALAGFILSVGIMYYLASGALGARLELEQPVREVPSEAVYETAVAMPSDTPMEYNVFGKRTQLLLIANRIAWIPYATAIDWFRYQKEKLDGDYVLGRSIRPIATITGQERLYLEREVAALQWGGYSGATSNALYLADAWLNWGIFGVIIYSAIFAATIKLIASSGQPPLMAASVIPVWIACFAALPPVFFSAGLGLLLAMAIIFRDTSRPTECQLPG